jgi:hypothetical protein
MALTDAETILVDILEGLPDGRCPTRQQRAELSEMRPRADDAEAARIDALVSKSTTAALARGATQAGESGVESDMVRETEGRPKTDPQGRQPAATARMFSSAYQIVS